MRFIMTMGVIFVSFLVSMWYTGAQEAAGFNMNSGFNKITALFDGGLALVVVIVTLAIVIRLIYWFGRDNHYTRREIVLISALILSWLAMTVVLGLWTFAWNGVWSRATVTVLTALAVCFICALFVNKIYNTRRNEKKGSE